MTALAASEIRRALRRPAVGVSSVVVAAVVVVFGYVLVAVLADGIAPGVDLPPREAAELAARVDRLGLHALALTVLPAAGHGLGAGVAVTLGALLVGADYKWRLWRMLVVRAGSRRRPILARVAAVEASAVVVSVVALTAGAGCAVALAATSGRQVAAPSVVPTLLGLLGLAGAMGAWALVGAIVAVFARGTVPGLVAALVVAGAEPSLAGAEADGALSWVLALQPGALLDRLVSALGSGDLSATAVPLLGLLAVNAALVGTVVLLFLHQPLVHHD